MPISVLGQSEDNVMSRRIPIFFTYLSHHIESIQTALEQHSERIKSFTKGFVPPPALIVSSDFYYVSDFSLIVKSCLAQMARDIANGDISDIELKICVDEYQGIPREGKNGMPAMGHYIKEIGRAHV